MSTPINKGSQTVDYQYGGPLTGSYFNTTPTSVAPIGIYSGALLTTIDNSDVQISAWVSVITDGTYTVTARTAAAYTVSGVSSTNNTIILRWFYNTQTSWFVDMLAVSPANVQANDLIIGLVNYSGGGVITGYNYSTRSNPITMTQFMKVLPTNPASMKVLINGGWCTFGVSIIQVPMQILSSSIVAPVANPRIDVIYVNSSGVVLVSTGTEAVNPVANFPTGNIVLAQITLQPSTVSISSSMITDARTFLSVTNLSFLAPTTLILPNVTSDPSSPVTGQIWLRTDF